VIKIFTPGPAKKQLPSVGLREYGASSENLQARARVQFASAAINGKTQQTRCPLENPQSKPWSSTTSVNELDVLTCESLESCTGRFPSMVMLSIFLMCLSAQLYHCISDALPLISIVLYADEYPSADLTSGEIHILVTSHFVPRCGLRCCCAVATIGRTATPSYPHCAKRKLLPGLVEVLH
jgi:hypothetical protein